MLTNFRCGCSLTSIDLCCWGSPGNSLAAKWAVFAVDIPWVMQYIWASTMLSQSLRDQFGKHEKKAFSLEEVVFAETTI